VPLPHEAVECSQALDFGQRARHALLDTRPFTRPPGTCPVGDESAFCKHGVALGLAWLADDARTGATKRCTMPGGLSADLASVRARHKAKRDLMKLLDAAKF